MSPEQAFEGAWDALLEVLPADEAERAAPFKDVARMAYLMGFGEGRSTPEPPVPLH